MNTLERAQRSVKDFGEAWAIQRRVIFALLMREVLTRYGRHNIGFLWLFAEPMIFTLGVTTLWTLMQAYHGSSLPIVAFAVTGYSSVLLWRNMPTRCIKAVEPSSALMYHRQVKVLDIFAARLLLEGGGATISFVVLSLLFWSIGWMNPPEDVLKVALAWGLLGWFGASLATFLGALSERTDLVERLWFPASYLLFPLSGAAFIVDALPTRGQEAVLWLPMVHGVELLREGYFGSAITAHYDIAYLVAWSAGLNFFGLLQTREVSRTLTPQ